MMIDGRGWRRERVGLDGGEANARASRIREKESDMTTASSTQDHLRCCKEGATGYEGARGDGKR